jgi:hypothetical protein
LRHRLYLAVLPQTKDPPSSGWLDAIEHPGAIAIAI